MRTNRANPLAVTTRFAMALIIKARAGSEKKSHRLPEAGERLRARAIAEPAREAGEAGPMNDLGFRTGPRKLHEKSTPACGAIRESTYRVAGAAAPCGNLDRKQKDNHVKNQSQGGSSAGARDLQQIKKLEMYWFLGLLLLAVVAITVLALTGTSVGTAIQYTAWVFILAAGALSVWIKRQKRLAMPGRAQFVEQARERADLDAVRLAKQTKGDATAVKELRRQEPKLSLTEAVEIVKGL